MYANFEMKLTILENMQKSSFRKILHPTRAPEVSMTYGSKVMAKIVVFMLVYEINRLSSVR